VNKRTRGRKWLSWAMGVALIIGIMLLGQWQSHREQADFDKYRIRKCFQIRYCGNRIGNKRTLTRPFATCRKVRMHRDLADAT